MCYNSESMKKILLLEDEECGEVIAMNLEASGYTVEWLKTIPESPEDIEFQRLAARLSGFSALVLDENGVTASGDKANASTWFSLALSQIFKGPIIANSTVAANVTIQLGAGCTHSYDSTHKKPSFLIELLKKLLDGETHVAAAA